MGVGATAARLSLTDDRALVPFAVAQQALAKAIELNPNYLQARLVLADLHLKAREPDLARKQCDAVLAVAPKNPQALLIAGNVAMAEGKKEVARERFETLIATEPENPAGYYRLGVLQRLTGDIESARGNLEKALELVNGVLEDRPHNRHSHLGVVAA